MATWRFWRLQEDSHTIVEILVSSHCLRVVISRLVKHCPPLQRDLFGSKEDSQPPRLPHFKEGSQSPGEIFILWLRLLLRFPSPQRHYRATRKFVTPLWRLQPQRGGFLTSYQIFSTRLTLSVVIGVPLEQWEIATASLPSFPVSPPVVEHC
jgi:hypothetical protein